MAEADESAILAEGYRGALADFLADSSPAGLLRLRGELQVVSRWLEVRKQEALGRSADAALDVVSRWLHFGQEIGGFTTSTRYAEKASLFDLAAVGVLAAENVLTAEKPSLMRILMSGLSEGLMFLGSRQYVAGGDAVLRAAYHTHAIAIRDVLWSLATEFRGPESLGSIREARQAIDALFSKVEEPGVPLGTKVALLQQLYGLVAIVRCAKLAEDLPRIVQEPTAPSASRPAGSPRPPRSASKSTDEPRKIVK